MQRWLSSIVLLLVMVVVPTSHAQADPTLLTYGDSVTGDITNRTFEVIYAFEGQADDVVAIEMKATNNDFDPYLYLTTLDNTVLVYNDDYNNLDAAIVTVLPDTATYQIVATRNGGRVGTRGGAYSLSLTRLDPLPVGEAIEGLVRNRQDYPLHVFVPPQSGIYIFSYTRTFGTLYPTLTIAEIRDGYSNKIAQLDGERLVRGQVGLELKPNSLYIVSFTRNGYRYEDSPNASATYTLTIDLID